MTVQDLIGNYSACGNNQDESNQVTYKGILSLSLDENNLIIAQWLINNTQQQKATVSLKTIFWSLTLAIKETKTKPIKALLFINVSL